MPLSGKTLWEAAFAEHYRWYFNGEWLYRLELTSPSPSPKILDSMLMEFGVARTLSQFGKEMLRKNLMNWSSQQDGEKEWCKIIRHAEELGKQHAKKKSMFVSGMSKVMWFSGGHDYPMFDRYTAKALGVADGRKAIVRAKEFYERLDELQYTAARRELASVIHRNLGRDASAPWAIPSRVIDKLLMFRGDDKHELLFSESRLLRKFFDQLNDDLSSQIRKAAKEMEALALRKSCPILLRDG